MIAYLTAPYATYPDGRDKAFATAASIAARLRLTGLDVYAPIEHYHPAAFHKGDAMSRAEWLVHDADMQVTCDALVICNMDGWESSKDVALDTATFAAAGKPVFDLNIETLVMVKRRCAQQ